jgi:plastocyanin
MRHFALVLTVSFLAVAAMRAVAADPQVPISIRDHQFVPSEVPVPPGVKVELVIKNEQAVSAEFESTVLHREKIVRAGGTITVFVGPLDPGTYEFFDDFNRATRGRLVVK